MFESFVRVRFHEVDRLGHVNNAAYLNYLEQAAIDHAGALGLGFERLQGFGGYFVAHRHEIDFLRPAFAGDLLRVLTWLGVARGARVERSYLIVREPSPARLVPAFGDLVAHPEKPPEAALVARARTEWVFATPEGKARRIPRELSALLEDNAGSTDAAR